MDIPSTVCRQIAKVNHQYRYGIGVLPGQGEVAFLAMLVDRRHAGSDDPEKRHLMATHVRDLGDRLVRLYDRDGSSPCVVPAGFAAVIIGWPGQQKNMGNAAVVSGNHAAWLERNGKPQYEIDNDRREAARENGRDLDRYVEGAADDLADYWKHLGNKETGRDRIFDKDDTRQLLKSDKAAGLRLTMDNAKEGSFEEHVLEENGFKR